MSPTLFGAHCTFSCGACTVKHTPYIDYTCPRGFGWTVRRVRSAPSSQSLHGPGLIGTQLVARAFALDIFSDTPCLCLCGASGCRHICALLSRAKGTELGNCARGLLYLETFVAASNDRVWSAAPNVALSLLLSAASGRA